MIENRYSEQFLRLKNNQFVIGSTNYKTRVKKLEKLKNAVFNTYKVRIREAMYNDFKKPELEVDFTEIYPIVDEIKHVVKHLRYWMKQQRVGTPISLLGSCSYIKHEPKGVCLIISPWNFPVNLTLMPLISAIAAGNTVIVKPSEMTPNTSKVLADIIGEIFSDEEIILIEGEAETAKELLKLPFNHIFFTGSPAIGKKVMEAASHNLTSVTLELGGKSPTIIDKSVNIKDVAEKLMFGKFMNAGQTCIAPDYVFVEESIKGEFISESLSVLKRFYSENIKDSQSYARIVNNKHEERLRGLIEDATEKGAQLMTLNSIEERSANLIAPCLVTAVNEDMKLMQEEIFGPLLPIKTFKALDDVVAYINANEKPLALYIFSHQQKNIDYVINQTRAGTTVVNHNLIQFINHNLPFGGSNNSGIGKSHGLFGFKEFSNERAVLRQYTFSSTKLIAPPYNKFKQKLVDMLTRWL